jgi:S-adenosylmethionine-dependent methyltransferase
LSHAQRHNLKGDLMQSGIPPHQPTTSPVADIIARFYDNSAEDEWSRLDRHRTEFALTLRALQEHLPPPPAHILDCGGGPGRYAIELAQRGYTVTLFDLSEGNLRLARQMASLAGVDLAGFELGTATDLGHFAPESFDAVLLMGPLYHLLELDERRQAIAEARRVLRPGGILCAAFIARYAGHQDAARNEPLWPLEEAERCQRLLSTGILPPRPDDEGQFVAYLAHPAEVEALFWEAALEVRSVLGLEGLVYLREEKINELQGEAWERWVDLNYKVAHDPSVLGLVGHLLVVAIRPAWRDVLRRIASQMDAASLPYKMVGGASAALHGIWLPVRDLDIETTAEGAYRFQEMFASHVLEPVCLSESEHYRSHFGRFDFEGVQVDIMGDLYRRDKGGWTKTSSTTVEKVEVEGINVNVSWLEEETLAYIRRGRLERAAQCLVKCNPEKLSLLLRGEIHTNVI